MAGVMPVGTFYPRRLSQYVPAMQFSSDGDRGRVSFGAVPTANATALLAAYTISTVKATDASAMSNGGLIDAPFGRNITVVASGSATGTITIDGFDYLGQPMSETLTENGTTAVAGNKAFKRVTQITNSIVATVALSIGTGAMLGLPFMANRVITEESDSMPVASLGTLQAPVFTDPQTATTAEPRGMFTPKTTPNGVKVITATFEFMNDTNAAGNGGLHGVAHFSN